MIDIACINACYLRNKSTMSLRSDASASISGVCSSSSYIISCQSAVDKGSARDSYPQIAISAQLQQEFDKPGVASVRGDMQRCQALPHSISIIVGTSIEEVDERPHVFVPHIHLLAFLYYPPDSRLVSINDGVM